MKNMQDLRGDFGEGEQSGRGHAEQLRMRQARIEAQVQLAEGQKTMARAMTESTRYMLWAVIACAASSVITVIAVLYGVFAVLPHMTH